jgi:hypothetical protein
MARRRSAIPRFSLFVFQDIITCVTGIMLLLTLVLALRLVESSAAAPPAQTKRLVEQLGVELESMVDETTQLEGQLRQQQKILDSGALVDTATLANHQADLDDRQKRLRSNMSRLQQQQQQVEDRKKKIELVQQSRSSETQEIQDLQQQITRASSELEEMQTENRVFFNPAPGSNRTPWLVQFDDGEILAAEMGKSALPQSFKTPAAFLQWSRQQSKGSVLFILLVKPDAIEDYHVSFDTLKKEGYSVGIDVLTKDQHAINATSGAGAP